MNPNAMKTLNRIKENVSEMNAKIKQARRESSGVHRVVRIRSGGQKVSEFATDLARKVGFATSYLTRRDLSTMTRDAIRACRRYPAQTIATAMALGFWVGRMRRG